MTSKFHSFFWMTFFAFSFSSSFSYVASPDPTYTPSVLTTLAAAASVGNEY